MKKQILSLALFMLTAGAIYSQSGGINYKAIINESGSVLANQSVDVKFTVLENGSTVVYEETHTTITDDNGILIVNIGEGSVLSGSFNAIDWSNEEFLKVQINTGNGFVDFGTTVFKYSPKAKYADKAGNVPTVVSDLTNDAGYISSEVDGDITNELQSLSLSGNQLSISNGNSVTLPSGTTGTIYTAGSGILINGNNEIINTGDTDITNEIQNLSLSGNQLSISDGNTVTLPAGITYIAGTGIAINGNNEIINTGDTDASDDFSGDYADLNGAPTTVSSFTNDVGYISSEVDADTTNEIQSLTLSGNQLSISDGNTVTLPAGITYTAGTGIAINGNNEIINTGDTDASDDFSGDYADLNGAPTTVSSFTNDAGYISSEVDADTTNEIQTLSISGNVISISNGNNITLPNQTDVDFLEVGTGMTPNNILDNIYHTGNISIGKITTPNAKLDIENSGSATSSTANTGLFITNNNTSSTGKVGVKTLITGTSTGDKYSIVNTIDGGADGNIYGVENNISNTNNFPQYGVVNRMSGSGSGNHFATSNIITGSGTGKQYGVRNYNSNSGNNTQYGVYSDINGSGSGVHYGNYTTLSGSGTGKQVGTNNEISNTGNNYQYGTINMLTGTGSGQHVGMFSSVSGSGTGVQYGTRVLVNNTSASLHYGNYTEVKDGSGLQYGNYVKVRTTGNSSDNYGNYTYINGSGTGKQYLNYNLINTNTGTGTKYGNYTKILNSKGEQYGTYNYISGTTNYNKYGVYSEITSASGGIHYAVFGKALKAGSYAGYFDGDVKVTKELHGTESGDADMKAYIYGDISGTSGTLVSSCSSDGYTLTKVGTGQYKITFDVPFNSFFEYIVVVSSPMNGTEYAYYASTLPQSFKIITKKRSNDSYEDSRVTFVVYKK